MDMVIKVVVGYFIFGFVKKVPDKVVDKIIDFIFKKIKNNQKFVNFCNGVKTKSRNVWQLYKNVVISGVVIMSILIVVACCMFFQIKQQENIKTNTTAEMQAVAPTKNTSKEDKQLEYLNIILQNPTLIKIIDTNDRIVNEKAKVIQAVIDKKITEKEADTLLKSIDSNIIRPEDIEVIQKIKDTPSN